MSKKNSRRKRRRRLAALRAAARMAHGGELQSHIASGCPLQVEEQFWRDVVAWETAPEITHAEQLRRNNIELPPPDRLDDVQLHEQLWTVIHALANLHVYLIHTDHLDDHQLYELLREQLLLVPTRDVPREQRWSCCLDLLGSCSEEDVLLYYRYYADEREWKQARNFWPLAAQPDRCKPPYDRDRHLPKLPELAIAAISRTSSES